MPKPKKYKKPKKINDIVRPKCAAIVREHGPQTTAALAKRTGYSINRVLIALVLSKELERVPDRTERTNGFKWAIVGQRSVFL